MFTAQQFSQLAAAAWSGPAAAHIASSSFHQQPCGYSVSSFTVSYHVGPAMYYAAAVCPFEAIATAIAAAAAAGVPVSRYKAQRVIARTAAALCGLASIRVSFAGRARRRRVARLFHG